MHAFDRRTDRLTDGRTDGQTDRQTEISSLDRVCIPCSAIKIESQERKTGMSDDISKKIDVEEADTIQSICGYRNDVSDIFDISKHH